jgi:hypothetical protein
MKKVSKKKNSLRIAIEAEAEWRSRLDKATVRSDSIWNAAIEECMSILSDGHYTPCSSQYCKICWAINKIKPAKRMDTSGHIPSRERIEARVDEVLDLNNYESSSIRDLLALKGDIMDVVFEELKDCE